MNGHEAILAAFVRHAAPAAGEIRIERRIVAIDVVKVPAGRVRLPDLDQRVGDRAAVILEHASGHVNALTDRLPRPARDARQIGVLRDARHPNRTPDR